MLQQLCFDYFQGQSWIISCEEGQPVNIKVKQFPKYRKNCEKNVQRASNKDLLGG